jgi:hypothetical protein
MKAREILDKIYSKFTNAVVRSDIPCDTSLVVYVGRESL